MDLLEGLTGNRVNYSANLLGGVKFDLDQAQIDSICNGLDFLEERTRHYLDVVLHDFIFLQRTRGIGVMTTAQAEVMGAVGPTARASNVKRDLRVEVPYEAYKTFPVQMALDTRGDLEARFEVRLKELFESFRLIRQILDNLPEGELVARVRAASRPARRWCAWRRRAVRSTTLSRVTAATNPSGSRYAPPPFAT